MRPETGYSYQCLHFETNCLLYVQCVQPPSELELWSDCWRAISSRIIYPDSVIDGCCAINTLTKLSPSLAPNNRLHTRWVTRDVMALPPCSVPTLSPHVWNHLRCRLCVSGSCLSLRTTLFSDWMSEVQHSLAVITQARKYFGWRVLLSTVGWIIQGFKLCTMVLHPLVNRSK